MTLPIVGAGWLGNARTRFVYVHPAVLWRSANALLGAGHITTPDNIRALVEAAYDEANTPAGLAQGARRAEDGEHVAQATAEQNLLRFEQPYDRNAGRWEPDQYFWASEEVAPLPSEASTCVPCRLACRSHVCPFCPPPCLGTNSLVALADGSVPRER